MFKYLSKPIRIQFRSFQSYPSLLARTPFHLADIGEGISEVEVLQWFVKPGDKVEEFSKICEVQSDKAAVEISSRYEGTILKLHHEIGAIAKVGSPLVDIETEDDVTAEGEKVVESPVVLEAKLKEQPVQATLVSATLGKAFATPAVRRIAKENNVDVNQITGSGPKGRVLKGDILDFVEQKKTGVVNSIFRDKLASLSSETPVEADSIKQLSSIQKAMFKSMTKSLSIPHFGYSDEIIMNATTAFRKDLNSYLKTTKGKWSFDKISYMPIFLKALSEALKQYPILNAKVINADTTPALQFRSSHNIGIAMDTPQGLVVPNVKNVQQKSIFEIAADLEALKVKGQKGLLTAQDLSNGTITLSNIGNIGGTVLHPVLVTSEVCIGALGKVQRLPRYETVNGIEVISPKEILNVSFNADHRVIDGATVGRFVQVWKTYLEHPSTLTANLK